MPALPGNFRTLTWPSPFPPHRRERNGHSTALSPSPQPLSHPGRGASVTPSPLVGEGAGGRGADVEIKETSLCLNTSYVRAYAPSPAALKGGYFASGLPYYNGANTCGRCLDLPALHYPLSTIPRSSPAGSTTRKVAPCPSWLSTLTFPPCASTNRCTIANPSPLPPISRVRARSVR